jgi:hypothetical protein
MAIFSKARRVEIFAATAAFAAVQVVFVGSVMNWGVNTLNNESMSFIVLGGRKLTLYAVGRDGATLDTNLERNASRSLCEVSSDIM